ncbi:DUF4190 domain-containing protein [Amycolatopsis sp. CA-230715]|uniref:DUF4190 domain-containing protein n=1 Tax=Amycolatopsis sp. CA-230715 TaxID=2745196 RepID=UPI001C010542|nr:DUF4190 domain-containing protein [Amycolatopsis sp. CA-230715]QWF78524.1 hypothetical protein HUW46_01920 [Amycolatopsis sp. CA-230715]
MSTIPQHPPREDAPVTQPKNGLGTAGFVLGLVGLVFSFIPIIGVVAWPLVIIGLVLAAVGFSRARKGMASNSGIAIAGVVLSLAGLIVCIVWAAAFKNAVDELDASRLHFGQEVQGGQTVEFLVTTDKQATVKVNDFPDSKDEVVQPGADWHLKAGFKGGMHAFTLSATAVNSSEHANMTCKIVVDGKTLKEDKSQLGLPALCSASIG